MKNPTDNRAKTNRSPGKWIGVIAVVTAVITLALVFRLPARAQALLQTVLGQIKELGYWGPTVFILLYIVSCMVLIPASVLTMGGGAIFGVVKASIYVSIAATLGATAAFLIGRYFARDWIHRKVGTHPLFVAMDRTVAAEGWKIVFLTRLCPIFPFFLMNYAYGLTRVSLRHYMLATWIGIMPGSTLFVYIGSLANVADSQTTTAGWLLKGFILLTAVWAVIYISKVARRALSKRISAPESEVVK